MMVRLAILMAKTAAAGVRIAAGDEVGDVVVKSIAAAGPTVVHALIADPIYGWEQQMVIG
jgi:hypothetical protein